MKKDMIDAILQERSPYISPQRIAKTLYNQRKDSAATEARQEVAYRMLSMFDEFCSNHGIQYFAIADTLVGAVVYGDFIPGSSSIELGLTRDEYMKLEKAYRAAGGSDGAALVLALSGKSEELEQSKEDLLHERDFQEEEDALLAMANELENDSEDSLTALDEGAAFDRFDASGEKDDELNEGSIGENGLTLKNELRFEVDEGNSARFVKVQDVNLPFILVTHKEPGFRYRKLMPEVRLAGYAIAKIDGELLYANNHLPMRINNPIKLSVFDEIPDDYDTARFLYWRISAVAKAAKAVRKRLPKQMQKAERAFADDLRWNLAGSYNGQGCLELARLVPKRSRSIQVGDISPTRALAFGPTTVMAPANTRTWVNENRSLQDAQVERLQSDALEIVAEIDRICRANGIGYFVCGGTMLGLVRHGGFIPWDDDMDIGMLRSDYERFLEVAPGQIDSERFFLQTRNTDSKIPYLFAKVRMNNSEYVTTYNRYRDFHKGICVDLFPFDKVPFETGELPAFQKSLKALIRNHNKVVNRGIGDMPSAKPGTISEHIAREVMTIRHERWRSKSLSDTQHAYEEAVTAYNNDESLGYVASFVPTFTMAALDDLLPYRDVEFEGLLLSAPAKPEVFLQMQYGDYMTEPLPHQQLGHGLLWWSDPKGDSSEFGLEPPKAAQPEHHVSTLSRIAGKAPAIGAAMISAIAAICIFKGRRL